MCDLFPIGPFNQHLRVRCYVPLFHISMVRLSSHSGIPGILSWEVQEVLEDPSVQGVQGVPVSKLRTCIDIVESWARTGGADEAGVRVITNRRILLPAVEVMV